MAKPVTGDMVKPYLNDEFGSQRLPIAASVGAPTAWTTWRFSGEAGRFAQSLEQFGQAWPFFIGDGGGEADMVEPAMGIVEPEEERSAFPAAAFIAEAADNAVSRPELLYLDHRPFARL